MSQSSRNLKADALAGFQVFLIALPLCLGIAMASGFPPVAGVLTAIIGGLLGTFIGSAELTIKGPAAGLIVIALGAVQELGMGDAELGYRRALAVGMVAAVVQIALALSRAGVVASIMPPFVVHGMLAAIGVIIVAKQAPVMMGVVGAHGEPLEMLWHLPTYLHEANPEVLIIGVLALATLLIAPRIPGLRKVPGPMLALLLTVPLGMYFEIGDAHTYTLGGENFELGPQYLVQLPGSLLNAIATPDFSAIFTGTSIKYILMFALVGSIESLLSVIAVDAMDPEKRVSDLNRDLLATGVANLAAAGLGGLPMISEIVRSKANIDAGATSRYANFFHGAFLLGFVALLPGLLQQIPLAALAAMLVFVGLRLASPKEFQHALHVGRDQLAVFVATCVVTLATDLLVGVAFGLALKLALHALRGAPLKSLFGGGTEAHQEGGDLHLVVHGAAVFPTLLRVRQALSHLDASVKRVVLDLHDARFVDHTFLEKLSLLSEEWPNAELVIDGLDELQPSSDHPLASRRRVA